MSWLKKLLGGKEEIDANKCMICHKELEKFVSSGRSPWETQLEASTMGDRQPYKCRQCGAPICKSCAQTSRCRKCGGNTFDLATA